MGIDFRRVATSALQAALEDGQQPEAKQHHRRLTAGKAIVAGAAVAVAAKYAVDKASPLKRKAAMAAVRHTVRNTFGDVIPESLHDKLMDSGFFDHEDEDSDGPQSETQDFFEEPVEEQSDDQDFFEEPDEEEESEDQDFFDEIWTQCFGGLGAVPGAAGSQVAHQRERAEVSKPPLRAPSL